MAIFGNMSKPTIALDHPIDDRITKIEETIEEFRLDLSILLAEVMQMQLLAGGVGSESKDGDTVEDTIRDKKNVNAATKVLLSIPFQHDLDNQEMHECSKAANRIYQAKVTREKDSGCLGRLPAKRQILAWTIINYRTINPVSIDIRRFIDGLSRIADYSPDDINWNCGETNHRSFIWMDDALVISVPEDKFPF